MTRAIFEGLVFDEDGQPVAVGYVGSDPVYIVEEGGFRYHVDARAVDAQVLSALQAHMQQHEELIVAQVMRLMQRDDLFTRAAVVSAMRNLDQSLKRLAEVGLPEEARQYLGLLGFGVVINRHGEVVSLRFPSAVDDPSD